MSAGLELPRLRFHCPVSKFGGLQVRAFALCSFFVVLHAPAFLTSLPVNVSAWV